MKELYTIASARPIESLGGIQGPLSTPTQLKFNDVLAMVRKGYVIYKHNPHDLTEKVRLNMKNINNISFKRTRAEATSQRLLNRSIQEMDKPIVTKDEVTKKVTKPREVEEMDVKELEPVDVVTKNTTNTKVDKKDDKKEIKVSKPDAFTK